MGHIIVLTKDGKIYGQGANIKGQLGKAFRASHGIRHYRKYLRYSNPVMELSQIPCQHKIIQVNAGKYTSILLTGKLI